MPAQSTIHASAVLLGEAGILIRGASGSGKSAIVMALIEFGSLAGANAQLIADDRVEIVPCNGRLVARPHAAIAGRIEARGIGIVPQRHERAAVIRLLVDLVSEKPSRMPEVEEACDVLEGVALPCLRVMAGAPPDHVARLVRLKLRLESNS